MDFRAAVLKLKNARKSVYEFHRRIPPSEPFRTLREFPVRFTKIHVAARIFALFILTLFLIYKFHLYFVQILLPMFEQFRKLDRFAKVYNLVFFDVFALTAGAVAIAFLIALFRPRHAKDPATRNSNHPVVAFLAAAPILTALLVLAPTGLADLFIRFSGMHILEIQTSLIPKNPYAIEALRAALCIALSIADLSVESGAIRWWTAPFLIGLSPFFNAFPLLWWNALAGWFPSRYWSVWKPVAVIATCAVPLLAFPLSQPIRATLPVFEKEPVKPICADPVGFAFGYQAVRAPDRPEIYLRSGWSLTTVRRNPSGVWQCVAEWNKLFAWDRAAFDFPNRTAYLFQSRPPIMHAISLNGLSSIYQTDVRIEGLPDSPTTFQHFNPVNGEVLVVVDQDWAFAFDTKLRRVTRTTILKTGGFVDQTALEADRDELYVLQNKQLNLLSASDFRTLRTMDLASPGGGMLIDRARNRLLIGYPTEMELRVYDLDTWEETLRCDAPIGVRFLAEDNMRGLLFLTSIAGVVEIRNADDLSFLRQSRIVPWIHWIEILPEFGEAIITSNLNNTLVWDYMSGTRKPDPFGKLFSLSEKFMKTASKHFKF